MYTIIIRRRINVIPSQTPLRHSTSPPPEPSGDGRGSGVLCLGLFPICWWAALAMAAVAPPCTPALARAAAAAVLARVLAWPIAQRKVAAAARAPLRLRGMVATVVAQIHASVGGGALGEARTPGPERAHARPWPLLGAGNLWRPRSGWPGVGGLCTFALHTDGRCSDGT